VYDHAQGGRRDLTNATPPRITHTELNHQNSSQLSIPSWVFTNGGPQEKSLFALVENFAVIAAVSCEST
jgi:hypothetical protein